MDLENRLLLALISFIILCVPVGSATKPDLDVITEPVLGQEMLLQCTPSSRDNEYNFTVNWYMNGTDLPNDTRYVQSGPRLNVRKIQISDRHSTFTCRVYHNSTLLSDASDGYNPDVKYGPLLITFLPSTQLYTLVEVMQNTLDPITCSADCYPACAYQWSRNGTIIGTSSVLKISGALRADDGIYICNAANAFGNMVSDTVRLIVEYKPEKLETEPNQASYELLEFDRLGPITCSATCNPTCTYKWQRDLVDFLEEDVLDISSINRRQNGKYLCVASNSRGYIMSNEVLVTVEYPPGKADITPQETSYLYDVLEHTVFQITCYAVCAPTCTYKWKLNDKPFDTGGPVLRIADIKRTESGNFSCIAENKHGRSFIEFYVNVEYGPTNVALSPANTQYIQEEYSNIGPITCSEECNPPCTFQWKIHNKKLGGQNSTLILNNTQRSQTGTYWCTATNYLGTRDSPAIAMTVGWAPSNSLLTIRKHRMMESESIEILCNTSSVPPSNITIRGHNQTTLYFTQNAVSATYTIPHVHCMDTGKIYCLTENMFGKSRVNVNLNIMCPPRAVKSSKKQQQKAVGENLDIYGMFLANPSPNVTWTFRKDKSSCLIDLLHLIDNFKMLNTYTNISTTSRAVLSNIQKENFGEYILAAENQYGKAYITFHMIPEGGETSLESPEQPTQSIIGLSIVIFLLTFGQIGSIVWIVRLYQQLQVLPRQNNIQLEDITDGSQSPIYHGIQEA